MSPTYFRAAAALVAVLALSAGWTRSTQAQAPSPAPPAERSAVGGIDETLAKVPLFSRLSAEGATLHTYTVPVSLAVSVHKLIFTFHFTRNGTIRFAQPDTLIASIDSIPKRYTDIFGQLGTPRTWPLIYDLTVLPATTVNGQQTYRLRGVPRQPSDVEYVLIATSDDTTAIAARWSLRGGWSISETIETTLVDTYAVPKRERADIVGGGYKIHSDMTYGDYLLNDAPTP